MSPLSPPSGPEFASIREVYAMVATMDAKTAASIDALKAEITAEMRAHEVLHEQMEAKRTSRSRWMVTTALAFGALAGGFLNDLIGHVWR